MRIEWNHYTFQQNSYNELGAEFTDWFADLLISQICDIHEKLKMGS